LKTHEILIDSNSTFQVKFLSLRNASLNRVDLAGPAAMPTKIQSSGFFQISVGKGYLPYRRLALEMFAMFW
jgi:hypothetical protein